MRNEAREFGLCDPVAHEVIERQLVKAFDAHQMRRYYGEPAKEQSKKDSDAPKGFWIDLGKARLGREGIYPRSHSIVRAMPRVAKPGHH